MNDIIYNHLSFQLKSAEDKFKSVKKPYKDYKAIYDLYSKYDFENFGIQTLNSLTENSTKYWIENTEEKLHSILFEYTDDWTSGDIEAEAYGISHWYPPAVSTVNIEMENYSLSNSFFCKPAFSINPLDVFMLLDQKEYQDYIDDKYEFEIPGYEELLKVFKARINFEVHKIVLKFSTTKEYKKINKHPFFMFLIEIHDKGIQTPLFIYI